jgi:hypothetical protein
MKGSYSEQEQQDIAQICHWAISVYRENVERHGQEPDLAQAKAMIEMREALAGYIEEIVCNSRHSHEKEK